MAKQQRADSVPVTGKWAAEFYDFLRIFGRLRNSVYGLLLAELGWTGLLILLGDVPSSHPDSLLIPWGSKTVAIGKLFLPGALVVLILWLLWSRFARYPVLIAARVVRWLLLAVAIAGIGLTFLIVLLCLPVTIPLQRRRMRSWIASLDADDLAKVRAEAQKIKAADRASGSEGQTQAVVVGPDERALESLDLLDTVSLLESNERWNLSSVGDRPIGWCVDLLSRTRSRARIGLAPLQTVTWAEDLNSTKVSPQSFSSALQQARRRLPRDELLSRIAFEQLPQHWQPNSPDEAARLRRRLGLDALLWGSYLPHDPDSVWLNVESRRQADPNQFPDRPAGDVFCFSVDESVRADTIIFRQNDVVSAYLALTLAILGTVRGRSAARSAEGRTLLRRADRLQYSVGLKEQLIQSLVLDYLPLVDSQRMSRDPADAGAIVARISSAWIGQCLYAAGRHEENLVVDNLQRSIALLKLSIEAAPQDPLSYYRLGVLYCLAGDVEASLQALQQAAQFERIVSRRGMYYAHAEAHGLLSDLDRGDVEGAKYLAHCARALNVSDGAMMVGLVTDLQESLWFRFRALRPTAAADPAWLQVLRRLMPTLEDTPAATPTGTSADRPDR